MARDYYQILELENNASSADIKKAYHRLSKTWHPDKNPDNEQEARRRFQDISEAYQVLIDDNARRQYDFSQSTGGDFNFDLSSDFFKTSDELFSEMFGGKTLDEAIIDFLNDPIFQDLDTPALSPIPEAAANSTNQKHPANKKNTANKKYTANQQGPTNQQNPINSTGDPVRTQPISTSSCSNIPSTSESDPIEVPDPEHKQVEERRNVVERITDKCKNLFGISKTTKQENRDAAAAETGTGV